MSENKVKLYANLKIQLSDLMKIVDCMVEPTLRDILSIIKNSDIPMETWGCLLRCNYIQEYIDEVEKHLFKNDGEIEYLELYWGASKCDEYKDGDGSWWGFHGVGKLGVIPQDLIDSGFDKDLGEDFRQGYAIEMSPLYSLSEYPIKIAREICITNFDNGCKDNVVQVRPSITVLEFFYYVLWELSYFGSPSERNAQAAELASRVQEIKEDLSSGNIKLIGNEEAKKKFKKYLSGKKTKKKKSGDK
ncbi:MAG: hypothetical protein WC375_05655 [Methanomassiliicoccales archaeon]|jgi:hypothetical protein